MTIEEIKNEIEKNTGVPGYLLTGETAEELLAQAKALLAYREQKKQKSPAEQFADWIGGQLEERDKQIAATFGLQFTPTQTDPEGAALAEIEEAARVKAGGYPRISDGGEVDPSKLTNQRPAREQFAEWAEQKTAFDPFRDTDGWKPLL